jgi:hypothetical protein
LHGFRVFKYINTLETNSIRGKNRIEEEGGRTLKAEGGKLTRALRFMRYAGKHSYDR